MDGRAHCQKSSPSRPRDVARLRGSKCSDFTGIRLTPVSLPPPALDSTDILDAQAGTYTDLPEVLMLAGRPEEAAAALEQARCARTLARVLGRDLT